MGIVDFCLRKPVLVAVVVLFTIMAGIWALISIPIQLTPDIELPTLRVRTFWPGASPYEIEREIVYEQEQYLNNLDGLVRMHSESSFNQADINLEFALGTDTDDALLRITNALNQVDEYPENALRPQIITTGANSQAVVWTMIQTMDDNPQNIREYRRFVENEVQPELEKIPGISEARIYGGRDPEVQVRIDTQRLALHGISIGELAERIRAENVDISGGQLSQGKREYTIRTLSRFREPEQMADLIVKYTDQGPVYLRDVAEVAVGYKQGRVSVLHNTGPSIVLPLYKETGANVLEISQRVDATIERLNRTALGDEHLHMRKITFPEFYINAAIDLVLQNLYLGGLLALGVLFLFLGNVRTALVVALSIPVSIIGTFAFLDLLGRNINVISLAGLAFAVGMVVDSAIVVLENIDRWRMRGAGLLESASRATKEVYGAILASALTTVAVFLPVVFVEDQAGQLFEDIAIAICVAIVLSLTVSTTVIPPFYRYLFMKAGNGDDEPVHINRLVRWLKNFFNGITPYVLRAVHWIQLRVWRKLAVVGLTLLVTIGIAYYLTPKQEYLPQGNRNLILSFLFPPPGYSPEEMERMGEFLMNDLQPHFEGPVGDIPQFDRAFLVAFSGIVIFGSAAVEQDQAAGMIPALNAALAKVPGMRFFTTQTSLFESGLGAGRSIDVEIYADDIDQAAGIVAGLFGKASNLWGGAQVRPLPSFEMGSPQIVLTPEPERAARAALSTQDIGLIVDIFTDGRKIDEFAMSDGDNLDLTLISASNHLRTVQDFHSQALLAPNGHRVVLGAVADIVETVGLKQVDHVNEERAFVLRIMPPDRVAMETALETIQNELVSPALEEHGGVPGFGMEMTGTADAFTKTRRSLQTGFILALAITFLLLVILFEDLLAPFVIMGALPVAAAGGLVALWLVNTFLAEQALDMLTLLGFLMLIGIVVNNPILIVSRALNSIREEGMALDEAVIEAVQTRIRPIFMTTCTSVFGLLPLVLSPGAGSELYRGIGSAVLGGLLLSTFVSLVYVPSLFSLLQDVQRLFGSRAPADEEDLLPRLARGTS